jgi:hypothetical protein
MISHCYICSLPIVSMVSFQALKAHYTWGALLLLGVVWTYGSAFPYWLRCFQVCFHVGFFIGWDGLRGMHATSVGCLDLVGGGVPFVCMFNICIQILFSSFQQFHACCFLWNMKTHEAPWITFWIFTLCMIYEHIVLWNVNSVNSHWQLK